MKFISKILKRRTKRSSTKKEDAHSMMEENGASGLTVDSCVNPAEDCANPKKTEPCSFILTPTDLKNIQASIARLKGLNPPTQEADQATLATRVAMVREIMIRINNQDLEGAGQLLTDDCQLEFSDDKKNLDMDMAWPHWVAEQEKIFASFPDFKFDYEKLEHRSGAVVVRKVTCSGTHTGEPYGFGPCDPIEATGVKVKNDPEELCFFFREGEEKFCRITVYARGEMSGPAGIYTQLGGFPLM